MKKVKCKFIGIISQGASYMVLDEKDEIIGYSDTIGKIDYDLNFSTKKMKEELEIVNINESAWN